MEVHRSVDLFSVSIPFWINFSFTIIAGSMAGIMQCDRDTIADEMI